MSGIMSIRQLIAYRVLMMGLGYIDKGEPDNIVQSLRPRPDGPRTRAQSLEVAGINEGSLDLVKRSFKYKFLKLSERMPREWLDGDPKKRKGEIKAWVRLNVEALQ